MKKLRPFITIGVLLATVAVFAYYLAKNPQVRHQLHHTSPSLLALLLGFYLITMVAMALINEATIRLCKIKISTSESLLITSYTAVVNFFGPLQSGPAFRAVYLKKKYNLNLKHYATASLIYYFFFGVFSGLMVLSGLLEWWLLILVVLTIASAIAARRVPRISQRLSSLDLRSWYLLALATFLQVSVVTLIYFAELRSIAPGTTLANAIVYTGAANLALFVSLTPGAIGFREAFLVFSRHLSHVSSSTIVAASILDRAVYIILLLGLAVFIFGTHAARKLQQVKKG